MRCVITSFFQILGHFNIFLKNEAVKETFFCLSFCCLMEVAKDWAGFLFPLVESEQYFI